MGEPPLDEYRPVQVVAAIAALVVWTQSRYLPFLVWYGGDGEMRWWYWTPSLLIGVPYVLIIWLLTKGRGGFGVATAVAQSFLGLLVGVPLAAIFVFNWLWSRSDRDAEMAFAWVLFVCLSWVMWKLSRRWLQQRPIDPRLEVLAFAIPFIFAGGAYGVFHNVMAARNRSVTRGVSNRESAKMQTMQVTLCARRSASSGHPAASVSDLVRDGCLGGEVSAGFRYGVRPLPESGFLIWASPIHEPWETVESYLGDGAGRQFVLSSGAWGWRVSASGVLAGHLVGLARCLVESNAQTSAGFPETLDDVREDCRWHWRIVDGTRVDFENQLLTYVPLGLTAFELHLRPRQYGLVGIRSYFTDETRVVRGTAEDRDATKMDEEVFKCESGSESCAEDWQSRGWMPEEIVTLVTKPKS